MSFSKKVVVVTGAASGIGRALADCFMGRGARVAMFDLDGEALAAAAGELSERHGADAFTRVVDVTDYNAFKRAVDEAIDELGGVDVFVNNAGIGVVGDFDTNTAEEIERITKVNYLGMVYGSRIIVDHFYGKGGGHLVNVSSVAGLHGFPRMSLYCGTKAGVINFSESLRFEARRHGVEVSVALPSTTDTPMIMDKLDGPDDEIPGVLLAIPLCKTGPVAEAIVRGVEKKKFMIFPTPGDRLALLMRNKFPGLFNVFVSLVGFRSFRGRRDRIMKKYGIK